MNNSKLLNFLAGVEILEEVNSKINGKITVVKDLAWGPHLRVGGLTQSGGVVEKVWNSTLKLLITNHNLLISKCLILGLGGGSVAKLVRKFWPGAKITGVDIDPIMVELGARYLGLGNNNVKIVISDALDFVLNHKSSFLNHFDLIIIDLYLGDQVPLKFESDEFLKSVRGLLLDGKIAVFNRLYYGEKRPKAIKFAKKLKKIFSKVEYLYPQANLMLICQ